LKQHLRELDTLEPAMYFKYDDPRPPRTVSRRHVIDVSNFAAKIKCQHSEAAPLATNVHPTLDAVLGRLVGEREPFTRLAGAYQTCPATDVQRRRVALKGKLAPLFGTSNVEDGSPSGSIA